MAKLSKITDPRLKNPDQYRLRYRIHFPDGGRRDRSRRYRTQAIARAKLEVATVLEHRTRQVLQTADDILVWQNEDLISREEAELLDTSPLAAKKTLRQAMDEYEATWKVSANEAVSRRARIRKIQEILGADTPLIDLDYRSGEHLIAELRRQDYKVTTVRRYL